MSQLMQSRSAYIVLFLLVQTTARCAESDSPPEGEDASVVLLDEIVYAEDRPDWLNDSNQSDSFPKTLIVVTDPQDSVAQSEELARVMAAAVVEVYVEDLPGADGSADFLHLSDQWIADNLVVRSYQGEVTVGGQTMHEYAVELEISQGIHNSWLTQLRQGHVKQRLSALGAMVVLGLAGLIGSSTVVGFLSRRVERREQSTAA